MRTLVLLIGVALCVVACGPSDEERQDAENVVNGYIQLGRDGDYEKIWFLIHPDDKAFYTWSVSLNQLQFLMFDAEDPSAIKADIEALEMKHGVKDVPEDAEAATPNPASMDAVVAHTSRMLEGVDHLALIKDAVALFEKHGKSWDPFHEFDEIEIERVDVFPDAALAVFEGDPEPRLWLSPLEGSWFVRYQPPPLVVVENWQREVGGR